MTTAALAVEDALFTNLPPQLIIVADDYDGEWEMANDIKIGILGGAGRMGQMIIRQVASTKGCVVAGVTARSGSEAVP